MSYNTKHKIAFYNACYYLCGLSRDNTSHYYDKRIKITDTLDAHVYRYLEKHDDFDEAYFCITFEKDEKKLWGTLIKFNPKKAAKVSEFFWNANHNIDYILTTLIYLKPSNSYFAHMLTPLISIDEQNAVIEKSNETINATINMVNQKTKLNKKVRKLVK